MKEKKENNILDIIGVALIVIAIVSSYGLYYTADQYSRVTEAQIHTTAEIINISATTSNGQVSFRIEGLTHNPSRIEIDVYFTEFRIYAFDGSNDIFIGNAYGIGNVDTTIAPDANNSFVIGFNYDLDDLRDYMTNDEVLLKLNGEVRFDIPSSGEDKYEIEVYHRATVKIDG